MRVLVIEYNQASLAIIRSLGRAGFEPDLLARWGTKPPPKSKYCRKMIRTENWDDTPENVERWKKVFEEGGYGCAFCCGDRSAQILSRYRDTFGPVLDINGFFPTTESFETAISKAGITRRSEAAGIAIPETLYDPTDDEVRAFAEARPEGVVIKRDDSFASKGVRMTDTPDEALAALDEMRTIGPKTTILAQQKVRGAGYLFHALYWNGQPMNVCLHRKTHEYPVDGGVSARAVTEYHAEPIDGGLRLLTSLDWHGLVKFDYMHSVDDGRWYIIEADPRVSASIEMTRVAAMNHVVALARLVSGESVEADLDFRKGIVYRWLLPRDVLATATHREWGQFILDFFRPNVRSDIDLIDIKPTLKRIRGTLSALKAFYADERSRKAAKRRSA